MIVIVGGGIVGLAAALHLAKSCAMDVTILQGDTPDFPYSEEGSFHRVSALTLNSIQFLQTLGVWPRILERRVTPLKSMAIFAESPRYQLQFTHRDVHSEQLGCIVENDLLVHALQEEITHVNNIHCVKESFLSAHRSGSHIDVQTDQNQFFFADLLLAADGADSSARTFFNMGVQEKNYQQLAITTVVQTDMSHHGRAVQHFYENEILGFLPIHEANSYSLVWSLQAEQAKMELEKRDDEFIHDLTMRMQNQLGKIISVGMRHAFPLKRQYAEPCYQSRVLLLGDALHRVHPLAGQGINLACKDIMVLADTIKQKKKNYALGDVHVLHAFQRRAKSAHLPMIFAIDAVKTIFSAPSWMKKYIISPGLSGLNYSTMLKRYFIQQAM